MACRACGIAISASVLTLLVVLSTGDGGGVSVSSALLQHLAGAAPSSVVLTQMMSLYEHKRSPEHEHAQSMINELQVYLPTSFG